MDKEELQKKVDLYEGEITTISKYANDVRRCGSGDLADQQLEKIVPIQAEIKHLKNMLNQ